MEIRTLRQSDAKQAKKFLDRIIYDSLIDLAPDAIPHYQAQYTAGSLVNRNSRLSFIMTDRRKIVGIALGWVFGGIGFLHWLGIDSAYRRKGLGTQMLLYYIQQCIANSCRRLEVYAYKERPWIIQMYKKHGFMEVYRMEKMWFNLNVVYLVKDLV